MPSPRDPSKQQITLHIDRKYVKWLDKHAKDLQVTRTKLCNMIFHGMMSTEKLANEPDSLFNLYSNHLEQLMQESMKKKKTRKK